MNLSELKSFVADIYGPGVKFQLIPYSYGLTFTALAPATTATQQLSIAANADFVFCEIAATGNVANAGQTVSTQTQPLCRILITDTGSNDQYMNTAISLANYASIGPSGPTGELYWPRMISGRSALTVQLTNYDAAQTYVVDVSLNGVLCRVYR